MIRNLFKIEFSNSRSICQIQPSANCVYDPRIGFVNPMIKTKLYYMPNKNLNFQCDIIFRIFKNH